MPERLYKEVDGIVYKLSDGVYLPITEQKSTRQCSWITLRQITDEFPEFFDKIEDIFAKKNPSYSDLAKNFGESIMTFLDLWGFLTWKQFDSVWRMSNTYDDYIAGKERGYYRYGSVVSINHRGVSFTIGSGEGTIDKHYFTTDREMDMWHKRLFGFPPEFEEEAEDGYSVAYRSDGSRYFALPTGDESLGDYLQFGIEFKGLRI